MSPWGEGPEGWQVELGVPSAAARVVHASAMEDLRPPRLEDTRQVHFVQPEKITGSPWQLPTHSENRHAHAALRQYWNSARLDLKALEAIPQPARVPRLPPSPRTARPASTAALPSVPVTPAMSPHMKGPSVPATPAMSPQMKGLRAIETWLRNELAPLPRAAPERLAAFRHVFNELIAQLPAHGPLLAEVKHEYEAALEAASGLRVVGQGSGEARVPSSPPSRALSNLHPLQMPAAYYEAKWRRCQSDLALASAQRQRLRRVVRLLRGGCVEAAQRVSAAGGEAASPSRATPRRWHLDDYDKVGRLLMWRGNTTVHS